MTYLEKNRWKKKCFPSLPSHFLHSMQKCILDPKMVKKPTIIKKHGKSFANLSVQKSLRTWWHRIESQYSRSFTPCSRWTFMFHFTSWKSCKRITYTLCIHVRCIHIILLVYAYLQFLLAQNYTTTTLIPPKKGYETDVLQSWQSETAQVLSEPNPEAPWRRCNKKRGENLVSEYPVIIHLYRV